LGGTLDDSQRGRRGRYSHRLALSERAPSSERGQVTQEVQEKVLGGSEEAGSLPTSEHLYIQFPAPTSRPQPPVCPGDTSLANSLS
jgi:hypothetical protein